ncbi:transferase, partial [Tanacetum coccineum]
REAHVMTFEVGAALEDAKWQVPWYCFEETNNATTTMPDIHEVPPENNDNKTPAIVYGFTLNDKHGILDVYW